MSGNTLGTLFAVTTFGESHGPAIGCVIDGCPPGMQLGEADIQSDLDRRKPGTSRHVTQRQEADQVEILSGVFEGVTTGTPIALLIRNTDQRSKDYGNIAQTFRPGHADYTYWHKYGVRDYRGGGRSSARLTAPVVAAGAVAKKWLAEHYGVRIQGYMARARRDRHSIRRRGPDQREPVLRAESRHRGRARGLYGELRKQGDSIGRTDQRGRERGAGRFRRAAVRPARRRYRACDDGAQRRQGCRDRCGLRQRAAARFVPWRRTHAERFCRQSCGRRARRHLDGAGHHGVDRDQATSSIRTPRRSIDKDGNEALVETFGRHDPCVGIRATPIAEALLALVLIDHALRHRAQCGDVRVSNGRRFLLPTRPSRAT